MLSPSPILFLNCMGSYFYSIFYHISKSGYEHTLLYYLSLGELKYLELSEDEVYNKYANNPWGYQPFTIINAAHESLSVDDIFYEYLSKWHNIQTTVIDLNHCDLFDSLLTDRLLSEKFYICSVDEFFLPQSKHYAKNHNKHFVLVKSIDYLKSCLEIIDSETNVTYILSFDELHNAIYKSVYQNRKMYSVNCTKFQNNLNIRLVLDNFLKINQYDFLTGFLCDAHIKLIDKKDKKYYLQGYYYAILSKALPYMQMIYHLLQDNEIILYQQYGKIVIDLTDLCRFMRFKIHRNDNLYDVLFNKIDVIRLDIERARIQLLDI